MSAVRIQLIVVFRKDDVGFLMQQT